MALYSTTETGPDVRYEDCLFVAYAHGQRLDAFDNSQQAWAAARSAAFAPVVESPLFVDLGIEMETLTAEGMSNADLAAHFRHKAEIAVEVAANPYDTGEYDAKWHDVKTPLPALACGLEVVGTHDVDGTPWTVIARSADGEIHASAKGDISMTWAGVEMEVTPDQLSKLYDLFKSKAIFQLIARAIQWEANELAVVLSEDATSGA